MSALFLLRLRTDRAEKPSNQVIVLLLRLASKWVVIWLKNKKTNR